MDNDFIIALLSGVAILIMFAVFIITFFTINKQKKQQLIIEKETLTKTYNENLLKTKLEIQENTIKTISQEIHDNIGQVLSLAKLNLATFPPSGEEGTNTKIENTRQLVSKAIVDLRNLSRSMYGDRIAELGLKEAVDNELNIINASGQIKAEMEVLGTYYKIAPQKEIVLFRIMQEALNNAIKYSRTKDVKVQLRYEPAVFTLMVKDNGVGFDVNKLVLKDKGIGLNSMQNRAELVGGTLRISSQPGEGTEIAASVPIN